ncbi:MAG: tyrosine-type recombinase/integrase [Flavobacteriales bacterium]|nr:tyrosine-type recombinase/integrase [Flavobacteriales bacterium]
MLRINFGLRDPDAHEATSIVLRCTRKGQQFKLSTGLQIHPKYWNKVQQKAREIFEFPEAAAINSRLAELFNRANMTFAWAEKEGIALSNDQFKDRVFENEVAVTKPKPQTFWDWYEVFLDQKIKSGVGHDVIKDYNNALRKHMLQFEIWNKTPLTIDGFRNRPGSLAASFVEYLTYYASPVIRSKKQELESFLKQNKVARRKANPRTASDEEAATGLALNTVGKQIKNLKVFLNWCFNSEVIAPFNLKHLVTVREEVDREYLTEDELQRIAKLTIESQQLDRIRDLFLFGCETGFRFGDFTSLRREHFMDGHICKKTSKSKQVVRIPCSTLVNTILEKYNYELPVFKQLDTFNAGVREICKMAGMDQLRPDGITRKDRSLEIWLPKWQLISSHTCRRTFCTLKFRKGMRIQYIMQFSGHKTEKQFMRYLKLEPELAAERLREYF